MQYLNLTESINNFLARGRAANCTDVTTLEMTKWFDSNDHHLVPELNSAQQFKADFSNLLTQVECGKNLNQALKVVVSGLLTFYLSRIVMFKLQMNLKLWS
mgnify:CR=1 FL=1